MAVPDCFNRTQLGAKLFAQLALSRPTLTSSWL
jgi:hypothetical protein